MARYNRLIFPAWLLSLSIALGILTGCQKPDWEQFDVESVTGCLGTLNEASEKYYNLLDSDGADAAAQEAVEYLMSQECTDTAGVSPTGYGVWVFFKNGLLGSIRKLPSKQASTLGSQSPQPHLVIADGGETVTEAVLVAPFDDEDYLETEDAVYDILKDRYAMREEVVKLLTNDQVTVNAVIEHVLIPGVLYWVGHGDIFPTGPDSGTYCNGIGLGEWAAAEDMAEKLVESYSSKLETSDFAVVKHDKDDLFYIYILPPFVSKYADLDILEGQTNLSKSLVYISCCCSDYPVESSLKDAFSAAGADFFCGYDWYLSGSFNDDKDREFFESFTDTCTAGEAVTQMGTLTDPIELLGRNTTFTWEGDTLVMLKALINLNKDGTSYECYSVLVDEAEKTSITGWARENGADIDYFMGIITPPSVGPGQYIIGVDDDAGLEWVDYSTGKFFMAGKDMIGVEGVITVECYEPDRISGTFSGTLGWWEGDPDPPRPPDETIQIKDGFFKHTGVRN
jgi:hypothetical protein